MSYKQSTSNDQVISSGIVDEKNDLISTGVIESDILNYKTSAQKFPVWALQPKRETGARNFLLKNPEYDGKGTIIAILDSGVDPAAGGMQFTTDGKRKVIDRIDASGAGDVDMSRIVTPNDENIIKGLTGRDLILPDDCCGYSHYRIGVKKAYSLYPKSLAERLAAERKEKKWDPCHKKTLAEVTKNIMNTKSNEDEKLYGIDKLSNESVENEAELLNIFEKKYKENTDFGPIFDVVMFHNDNNWVVLIDTSECGDLNNAVRLRPFYETGDFAYLTKEDNFNVSVNVYDEGDIVQIVGMCSSHGTHVASIAAAHFPDDPDKNGLAPGAQIVSITIGDSRLGSMESGTALVRAMTHIMQATNYKVDLINMSYGEHSNWSNAGRIGELMAEVINKHGVIWVASAGNAGPALCTVGSPPDISTNTIIGVGAYVSPEMMGAMYSTKQKLPGTSYTWTSRGPTIDGDRGVTICAPGGAITSVPHFTLRGTQLMNGTSMASPHACGAISLLLSGLKQLDIGYSPFSIKRALMNTALHLSKNCLFAQGHGLLQIGAAFEYLRNFSTLPDTNIFYKITCFNDKSKGIHLRKPESLVKKQEIPIKIEPFFLNNDFVEPKEKINFNMKFSLVPSCSWIEAPEHLDLMFVARYLVVSVDPTKLPPGVNTGSIKAYDIENPNRGFVFEIFVTVVIPEPLTDSSSFQVKHDFTFSSGSIRRHFINVPDGASWAEIRLKSKEKSKSGKFILHTVQLIPKTVVQKWSYYKMFSLNEQSEFVTSLAVKPNSILEVCFAKWWANGGDVDTSYSITFRGLVINANEISFHGAAGIQRLDIYSPLKQEDIQPEIKLKSLVQNYRPTESKIEALCERDIIPPNRIIYELQLVYNFSVGKPSEITPNFPWFSDVLYESEFESQLWALYNSHKQLVAYGDAFPLKWATKVDKEDYVLRLHVRSESKETLDKFVDMPMMLSIKVASSSMEIYSSFAEASTFGRKLNSYTLQKGECMPIYVAPINGDKWAKNSTQGQYLTGTLTLTKDELGKKADFYKVNFIFPEFPKKDSNGQKNKVKNDQSYAESLNEFNIKWLSKLDPNSEEAKMILDEMKNDTKINKTQVNMARLNALELEKTFSSKSLEELSNDDLQQIKNGISISNEIISQIDIKNIMYQSSIKQDSRQDAAEIKKLNEKNRNWYIEASAMKGLCHCFLNQDDIASEILLDLMKLVDPKDPKVIAFTSLHAEKIEHYGRALKLCFAQLDVKPGSLSVETKIVRILNKLGWNHIHDYYKKNLDLRYPESFELF